ncbi:polyprotein [Macluravirus alipiniatessallati]|uniref:Polyprotein n=1 Tax=Macluravirus alipiniatessallati TaxID=2212477 RepID=A0A2U9AG80_9POTY|nr:polyprotein [Alpinia oxyphylla mosaic virus]AWO77093.1 polyprotein [Alpinia oxyphylla mosaic virus]
MASNSKIVSNFKVEVVDFLNTHAAQITTGKNLNIEDKTRSKVVAFVRKQYINNELKDGKDFVMIDGKGKTVANFPTTVRGTTKLKDFLTAKFEIPDEQSFERCDKIIKCVKAHQQQMAHMRTISNDYAFGGLSKICPIPMIKGMVPNQGMCFLTLLISTSYFITPELDEQFSLVIDEVLSEMKPWLTLQTASKIVQYIICKIPVLAHVPIPAVAVDHMKSLIHVCDQRGVPSGWHVLKIGTLAEFANIGIIENSKLTSYFVGGSEKNDDELQIYVDQLTKIKKNFKEWVLKGNLFETLKNDMLLTAFLVLSPAHLSKLHNFLESNANEALQICELDTVNKNKILAATIISTGLKGVRIKWRETSCEKLWLHLLKTIEAVLEADDTQQATNLRSACERMYEVMCANKKFVYCCEKRIYYLTDAEFQTTLGFSPTWFGALQARLGFTRASDSLTVSKIRLSCFSDNIVYRTLPYVNAFFLYFTIQLFATMSYLFSVARIIFYCIFVWHGIFSISSLVLMLVKSLIVSRLSRNYNKLLICGTVFCVFELGRYIIKQKQRKNQIQPHELQAGLKTSEKQMMSAMAMLTLLVHAFDMDLAVMMSNSLNHVARLANMLTDTTSGWMMGGTGTQELQMELFDLVLEADEKIQSDLEEAVTSHRTCETFASWMSEQSLTESNNTRPLSYGRPESYVCVDRENAVEIGQNLVDTTNAWTQVIGQTGSGKSTRVPIAYYNRLQHLPARRRSILVCEPTQATTQNVSYALSHQHGKQVFYQHEGKTQNGDSSIQVMTYGTAFFKAMNSNEFIEKFDAVFLDESHLISAHSLAFESYLNKCTTVRKFYLSATPRTSCSMPDASRRFEIYEHSLPETDINTFVASIGKGDSLDALNYGEKVLIFLSGREQCNKAAHKTASTQYGITAFSLHKENFSVNYSKILQALSQPGRVYIYSTNILETGVTLNVDVVVDFGYTNQPHLDLNERTLLLQKRRVTESERKQRIGRAGRLKHGHAIVLGKTSRAIEVVTADVVFDAALLSFVYNLEVYVNTHLDSTWLAKITREQARTMLSFRLSTFFMRDLVNSQGHIRPELLDALKNKTWRSLKAHTTMFQARNSEYQQWQRLDHYSFSTLVLNNERILSEVGHVKIPFITHDMMDFDIIEIVKAVANYKPNMLTVFGQPKPRNIGLIMRVDETNVFNTMRMARLLKSDYEQQILNKKAALQAQKESPMAYFLSTRVVDSLASKLSQQISQAERNIVKLTTFITNLEIFMNTANSNVEQDMQTDDLEEIGRSMQLQMDGNLTRHALTNILKLEDIPNVSFREAILIGNKRSLIALSFLVCSAFAGLAWYLTWDFDEGLENSYNKRQRVAVHNKVLEMKGKGLNRDKRNVAMQETYDEAYTSIRDDEDFDRVRSRRQRAKETDIAPVMRHMRSEKPFITLYDLTLDSDITHAVFSDHNSQAFYETANPLANLDKVKQHLEEHRQGEKIIFWSDMTDDTIFMTITKKDGSQQRVKLTPHASQRKTKTGGVQGYASHEGEYRQTGDVEILKQPTQVLEIGTQLTNNQANLDILNMIGHVNIETGRLHCILYKDFIIMPAHVMQKELPITLSFKHYTVKVEELGEVYAFVGFDLILMKRPHQLAPVKCVASISQAQEAMIVQMVHKKFVTLKPVITITAAIHQTKEMRWAHQIPTIVGMCGAPVLDTQTGKIVGIHVMGDTLKKHNVFETFPSEALEILGTNDKKVHQRYFNNRLKAWKFQPEVHGYDPRKIQGLQNEDFSLETVPNDVSMYTIENIMEDAAAGGLFKPREVRDAERLPIGIVAQDMTNLAFANALLNKRHVYIGESPYWTEFKRRHAQHVKGIHEFEDEYAPSILSYDAYWKDLLKFNRQSNATPQFDKRILNLAAQAVIRNLQQAGLTATKIRTTNQVLDDVQWTTAAGPLYAMKKKELCKDLTEEELQSLAIHVRQRLIAGKNCGVWNGSMKAELRSIEKVQQAKTRVFTAAPITTLIASKFFVDDFNKQFYETHLKANHTVGINKFSRGWERLYNFLDRPGWKHGSGDGSRFDSSIDAFWFDYLLTIRLSFFTNDERAIAIQALKNMYREFLYTPIHTVSGNILVKQVGNNSGQPSTVVDNTLILMMSFFYAYICKTGDDNCEFINERFRFVCNGDDNKFSVSPQFASEFGTDFSGEIKQLGLNYIFDAITDDITENPYMSLTMVRTHEGIGFTLHPSRIIAITQWMKKGNLIQATQAAFAAMVEAYNDPWLFGILHLYLVWLIIEFRDELEFAKDNDVLGVTYMDPCQVHALHYGINEAQIQEEDEDWTDDEDENLISQTQHFQMDLTAPTQRTPLVPTTSTPAVTPPNNQQLVPSTPMDGASTSQQQPLNQNREVIEQPPQATPDSNNDENEIEWRIPPIPKTASHFNNPVVKGKRLWNSRIAKNIDPEQFEQTSQKATTLQFERWVEKVKKNLGNPSEQHFQIYLTSWCLWCANNGTSSKVATNQMMEIHATGQFASIPISIFVDPAIEFGGLRKIMRHLSDVTSKILEQGGKMTAWGKKRGFTQLAMIPYAFDFCVQSLKMPKTVREQLNQSKAAAIGSGHQRVMLMDGKIQRSKTSYERHVDTDVDEFEHGGAIEPRATLY